MARRYDLVAQYGSNWRSPLWIPVVNGRRTVLDDFVIRGRVIAYSGDRSPYFRWVTGGKGIEIVTVKLRRKDGTTFDTSGFHLELSPSDWAGKRRGYEGDLEIDLQSANLDEPRFRQKIVSSRRFRVTTDTTYSGNYGPEIISDDETGLEVLEYEYEDVIAGAEIVSVSRDQLEGPASRVTDLEDVDIPVETTQQETILVRDPTTGVFRATPLSDIQTETRGSVIHYVDQKPTSVQGDVQAGDWYTVISGGSAGEIYEVREV